MNFEPRAKWGFTIIEVVVAMGIVAILSGITFINLPGVQHRASLDSSVSTFVADLKSQQHKAMMGDTEGRSTSDTYGIYFNGDTYVLFHGASYSLASPDNYSIKVGDEIQFADVLFPSSQIVFSRGTGEVSGFIEGQSRVTLQNLQTGEEKTITINRYGVVTNIN